MSDLIIDFSKQSNSSLKETLGRINRDKFPQNYESCLAEIKKRQDSGTWSEDQSLSAQIKTQTPKMIAGFWLRVVADAIDMAILWAFALVLSIVMESWFVRLGENGVWIGLFVSMIYFVSMQSSFGNGQSFGKRIMGIQVLDLNGQVLPLMTSFLRYLVIAFVSYVGIFSGIVNLIVGPSFSSYVDLILGSLWLISLVGCYLLLLLHPLKRGLHDLVAGSVVVNQGRFNSDALANLNNSAKTKKALVIVGVISVVTVAVGISSYLTIAKNATLASLQEIQQKLESTGQFHSITVSENISSSSSGVKRSIIIQTHVDGPLSQTQDDLKQSYDIVFQTIRDQIKDLTPYSNIRVGLRLGYDLGIRRRYTTLFQDENPQIPGERKNAGSRSNF